MRILKFLFSLLAISLAVLAAFFWIDFGQLRHAREFVENQIFMPPAITIVEQESDTGAAFTLRQTAAIEDAPNANAPDILAPEKQNVLAPAIQLPDLSEKQTIGNGALTRAGIIAQTNIWRQIHLGQGFDLKENSLLDIAAAAKVKDMFDGQYFEHISPAGYGADYFAGNANYQFIVIGENLAKGNYANDAVLAQAWMDSPGHRENILKAAYQDIGVAVAYGMFEGGNTWLAVQIFATPESAYPQIDANLALEIDRQKTILNDYAARQDALLPQIERQKAVAQALKSEYDALVVVRADRKTINAKLDELNDAVAMINANVNEYNADMGEARAVYERHKSDIEKYNAQVKVYNACVAVLE